ncbi:MAG: hypothetical protein LBN94_02610, partial [Puniceicoccales bacterium]|nr:hypothetical protein [Puniceicoccales bacterium]
MSSFTKIPSFLFIFILWSILPLPGEIFRATSEDEACQYLEKVYGKIENIRNDAMLFVDIDETLIHNSSDIGSYQKHGDLRAVEAINGKLIELLRQLKDIKIVGITSSRTQTLNISPQNNLPQNDQDCFLNLVPILISVDPRGVSTTEKTTERKVQQTASWIRSKALTSAKSPCLHLPLFNPYPNRTISLPLATQLVPDLPPATDDFPLRNLQYNSATEVTLHRYFSPFLQKACFDLYVQGEKKGEETQTYGKIIACPTYENGVIFSNFFHLSEAWQKGLPMRAFLSFFSKKFLRT